MLKTLQNAFKIKEVRSRLLFTLFVLVIVRIGCEIPVPGVNTDYIASLIAAQQSGGDAFNFFDALTGGSFMQMSIFALNITPYITSSIIVQLLTIAIPKLEEMHRDGEEGRKKIVKITRYLTVALALIESLAMAIGFGGRGLLPEYNVWTVTTAVMTMTAGSAVLMWLGERITEKGVGNGISIILLINIVSGLPDDMVTLYEVFIQGKNVANAVLAIVIIVALLVLMIGFVVLLQGGERRIPVQYAKKMQGRKMVGGQSSNIPVKVNTAGVIPVIFASSLMTLPVIIAQFFDVDPTSVGGIILGMLSSSNWLHRGVPVYYNVGLVIYIVLIVAFAYFYTSITFNPIEIANNMKKQGGFIPGIRPGKYTSDYLQKIFNYIIFVGAAGLIIVAVIPIAFSGWFSVSQLSFMGTSLIIIVGVVLETLKQIESLMLVRYYKGFLND